MYTHIHTYTHIYIYTYTYIQAEVHEAAADGLGALGDLRGDM